MIFSETFRPKWGVFPISTGVFRSHSPALLVYAGAERGKREGVQRARRFWIARREDNSMLVRRLGVRRGARAKSFPHFPVAPFIFFRQHCVAACYTRISEFCSSFIRFPVCMRCVFFARPRQLFFVFFLHLFTPPPQSIVDHQIRGEDF